MSKSTIFASDLMFDLIDSIRESEKQLGSCETDATAFTLGYIGSAVGGIIECLPPKTRKQVMKELQSRIDTAKQRCADRAAIRSAVAVYGEMK